MNRAGDRPTATRLLFPVALIVLATAAAYSNSLHAPFVFDDLESIAGNSSIRHLWPHRVIVDLSQGRITVDNRPVYRLTLAVNYALGGLETRGYHLMNVAIHLLAGLTLFGIVRRTLLLPGLQARFSRAATPLALTVALLWALHPVQTAAVTYLTQRHESLMGLFSLLALYGVVRSSASPRPGGWEAAAVAAVALALGTKEVAVSAPFCILLYDRTFLAGTFREAWARRGRMYRGLGGCLAAFALYQLFTASRSAWAGYRLPVPWFAYAATQPGVILHYLRLSLWPHPLVLDYGWPVASTAATILPGAAAVGALAAASAAALVRRRTWGFLGAAFFLILAPTSSILPLADLAFLHRMYLPLAPVVIAVVLGGYLLGEGLVRRAQVPARPVAAIGIVLAGAIAASLAVTAWRRNQDFASRLAIWTDTVAKVPGNARARNNLGQALLELGRTEEALARFQEALKLNPDNAEAHNNVGFVLKSRGQLAEAIAHYERALEIKPALAMAHNNLGLALAGRGRLDEAIGQIRQALAINPDLAEAHHNLGIVLTALGRREEGLAHHRRAVEIKPDFAEARDRLNQASAGRGAAAP